MAKYFPQEQIVNALRVMYHETAGTCDPSIIGDTQLTYWTSGSLYGYSVGLMQIRHLAGRPEAALFKDPEYNIRYAARMWYTQGFCPWTAARNLGIVHGC